MRHLANITGILVTTVVAFAAFSLALTPTAAAETDGEDTSESASSTYDGDKKAEPYRGGYRQMRVTPETKKYRYPFVDHRGFFRIGPRLGGIGVFGDIGNAAVADVSAGPDDAIENLDLATGVFVEAGYGNIGVSVDFSHLDLSTNEVTIDGDAELAVQKFRTDAIIHWNYEPFENLELGPTTGLRHMHLSTDMTDDDDRLLAQPSESWIEPLVGLRARYTLAERFFLAYDGNIGGIAFGSDVSMQSYGGLGINAAHIDFELGYRHLYVDYESDTFEYNVVTTGPEFRTLFRF